MSGLAIENSRAVDMDVPVLLWHVILSLDEEGHNWAIAVFYSGGASFYSHQQGINIPVSPPPLQIAMCFLYDNLSDWIEVESQSKLNLCLLDG